MTYAPPPVQTASGHRSDVGGPPPAARRVTAGFIALAWVAAGVLYGLLASSVLPGAAALTALVGLLVALPTADRLARRIALNGSLLFGWAPVLWWVRWPVPVDHGAVVVAGGLGCLATVVSLRRSRGTPCRLLPRVTPVDMLPLLGGILTVACMWRWAFPGSARGALTALLPGVDNYAHYHLFATIRTFGATTGALGVSPDGTRWAFDSYPQGFHALVAMVSELMHPDLATGPSALAAYTQGVAVLVTLGLVMLTSAVVSLPGIRDRPLVALPAVTVTWAAFLWNPGQHLLVDGFANFWLAAAAVATALLVALPSDRRLDLIDTAAVGGLLVWVAFAWAPLIVLAAPAVLLLLHPVRGGIHGPGSRQRWCAVAVLVVAALGVAKAFVGLLTTIVVTEVVQGQGGIHGTNPLPAFSLLVAALYVFSAGPAILGARAPDAAVLVVVRRARLLLLTPLGGVAVLTIFYVAQTETLGTSGYYFLKFFMGLELVLAAVVPAFVGLVVIRAGRALRERGRRWPGFVALVATVLATQSFGLVPAGRAPLLDVHDPGTASLEPPFSTPQVADGVLAAAAGSTAGSTFHRDYLAIGAARAASAFYPDGWYHAISDSLSAGTMTRLSVLRVHIGTVRQAAPVARRLLRDDPLLTLVVDPAFAPGLRAAMDAPALARRIVGWRGR